MDALVDQGPSNATLLADLTARRTRYDTALLRLYQSSFVPDQNSVLADFDAAEATFTGYAGIVLAMNAIGPDADGGYVALSQQAFFQATDAVAPNTIGGAYIRTAAGALLAYFPFPAPVPMDVALAYLAAVLELREPQPDQMRIDS